MSTVIPYRYPKDRLQNQLDSYYFTKTMRLKPNEVYMSPLDLNVEQNQVEVPYKPMLRLATPVQDRNGRPRGILIVNIAAQSLLDAFTESVVENRDHVMLVNPEGYWLRSSNPRMNGASCFSAGKPSATATRKPGRPSPAPR